MKIVAISGALRKASTNTGLLRAVKELAPKGVNVEIVTLHGIPLYDGDVEESSGKPQIVKDLDARISAADAVIIATPEYNFSIPGVLKNATDWLSRHSAPLKWKRVAIMGASDGPVGTARVQYHLRQNLQALQAIVMPKPEFFATHSSKKFDKDGDLVDDETRKFLTTWVETYVKWVETKL